MDSDNNKDISDDLDFEIVSSDDEAVDQKESPAEGAIVTPPPAAPVSPSSVQLESSPLDMDDDVDMTDDADDAASSAFDLGDEDEGLEEISGVSTLDADTDFSDLDDVDLDASDDDFSNDLADYSDYDLSGGGDDMDDFSADSDDVDDIVGLGAEDEPDAFFASRPGGAGFASAAQSKGKSGGSRSRMLLLVLLLVVVVGGGGLYFMSATSTPGIQMPPPVQPAQVGQMDQQQGFDPAAPVNPNQPFNDPGLSGGQDMAASDPNAMVDQNAPMADPNAPMADPNAAMANPNAVVDPNAQAPDPFADPTASNPADMAAVQATDATATDPNAAMADPNAMVDPNAPVTNVADTGASPEVAPVDAAQEVDPFTGLPMTATVDPAVTPSADPTADGVAALDNAVADLEAEQNAAEVDPALTVAAPATLAPSQVELVDPNAPVPAPATAEMAAPGQVDMVAQGVSVTPTPDAMAAAADAGAPLPMPTKASNTVFFDSAREARVAQNSPQIQGPELVDPRNSPASRFVVVENVVRADNQESERVAAQRALMLGRYDAALGFYESLYSKNQRDPRILMGYALALQKTGRVDEALDKYDELLTIAPNNTEALVNAMGLIQQQNPAAAIRALEELRAKNPANAGVAAQLGIAYASGGDYANARKYLGIATTIDPKNAMNFYNLGNVAERMGQRSEAVRNYEKALEVDAVYGDGRSVPRDTIYDRLSVLR